MCDWRPIATAPRDGQAILLLSAAYDSVEWDGQRVAHPPRCIIGSWDADGTSWVDALGQLGGDCVALAVTGVWSCIPQGWAQPNEVTHWMPLPLPPQEDTPHD